MNNIKLTLSNWGDLDLGGETAIPLNFNLNDIRDISSRGGEYSKTIKLYGTAHNNNIIGPLFDVNTEFLTFNPQVVEPCVLSRDGEVVLDGTFQIRKITKRYTNEDSFIIYDVYLKSNNSDFYTLIDGRFLTDLDMSSYNHYHTKDVIMNSIKEGTLLEGYQYYNADTPLTEYPNGSGNILHIYEPDDFRPAIYVKTVLDRIVEEAGFTYEFDKIYEYNIDKLIITTNRERIIPGIIGDLFRAGITNFNNYNYALVKYPNIDVVWPGTSILPGRIPASGGNPQYFAPCSAIETPQTVVFDNDDNSELNLFDNGNAYSTVVGEYVLNPNENTMYFESTFIISTWIKPFNTAFPSGSGLAPGTVIDTEAPITGNFPGNIRLDTQSYVTYPDGFSWNTTGGLWWKNNTESTEIKERVKAFIIAYDVNDNPIFPPIAQQEVGINEYSIPLNQKWRYLNLPNYTNEYIVNISGEFVRFQNPNAHKIKVVVTADFLSSSPEFWGYRWDGRGETLAGVPVNLPESILLSAEYGFDTFVTNPIGYFKNAAANNLSEGAFINMNNVMPVDFKQSEFLLSLVKMYNLYIQNDKNNYKHLIIKTRDDFYEGAPELNWNEKVDINSIELEILSNTQTKIKNFLYAEDSDDDILKSYKNFTKFDYGELEYVFFNQFIRDISEVKPDFSTAVLEWKYKKNIPLIPSRGQHNVRIMSVGQLYQNENYFTYRITNPNFGLVLSTEDQFLYRHVGHFYPNSFEPKEDINFGVCDFYTHNYSTITNNNLFNRFYRKQFDIFEKGYMMKAKFKLNYYDIARINMNERIWINNAWWHVNKIIDFDLNANKLTDVELITADPQIGDFIANHNLFIEKRLLSEEINIWGKSANKSNKYQNTNTTEVYGRSNKIDDNVNSVVVGDFNYVRNKNGLIIGSSNIVDGSGLIVLGGFNKTYTGENKVYINGLIEDFDLVDAGEYEVLCPFNDVNFVLVDAGKDEIIGLDSATSIQLIDGGQNQ